MPLPTHQEEFSYLSEKQFLLSTDNLEDVQASSYPHKIWAEVFWRRRSRHAGREDPELKYILKTNPSKILEIGAGYGRVLRKLMEWKDLDTHMLSFTGIEMCNHFQPYFQRYQAQYPSLQRAELIWDNFLTTSVLEERSFDIILLPMNTLANLSYQSYETLFKTVNNYLTEEGMFFFSNYKIPSHELLDDFISQKHGYSGDLLLELGSGLITAE
ncbi:MAG: class I SAM-dependent methyltransferase, partial [Candidatus Hodarchaeales archaeon]